MPAGPTGLAATTTPNAGLEARVPMLVETALKPLRQALRLIDPVSESGQELFKAMSILAKHFGTPSADLTQADMKLLGEQTEGVSPANPAAFANMQRMAAASSLGQPPAPPPSPMGGV